MWGLADLLCPLSFPQNSVPTGWIPNEILRRALTAYFCHFFSFLINKALGRDLQCLCFPNYFWCTYYTSPIKFDLPFSAFIAPVYCSSGYVYSPLGWFGSFLFSEQNLILPLKQMLNSRYEPQNTILCWWYYLLLNKSELLYFYLAVVPHN